MRVDHPLASGNFFQISTKRGNPNLRESVNLLDYMATIDYMVRCSSITEMQVTHFQSMDCDADSVKNTFVKYAYLPYWRKANSGPYQQCNDAGECCVVAKPGETECLRKQYANAVSYGMFGRQGYAYFFPKEGRCRGGFVTGKPDCQWSSPFPIEEAPVSCWCRSGFLRDALPMTQPKWITFRDTFRDYRNCPEATEYFSMRFNRQS